MTQALAPEAFKQAMLDRLTGKRHGERSIVRSIFEGRATPEQVGYLGVLFYHFTKHTPQVLSTIHSRCTDRKIRRKIMDVLIDEDTELRCGTAGHDVLAMDFATRYTGLSEDEVETHPVPSNGGPAAVALRVGYFAVPDFHEAHVDATEMLLRATTALRSLKVNGSGNLKAFEAN